MYKKACKEALNYIRPIIIGKKYYNNNNIINDIGTLIVLNKHGDILTTKEIAENIILSIETKEVFDPIFKELKDKKPKQIKKIENKYKLDNQTITNLSVQIVDVAQNITNIKIIFHNYLNLAIIKSDNNDLFINKFPKFSSKDIEQGQTYIATGFAFPEYENFEYNFNTNEIESNHKKMNFPTYPIEGIITRNLMDENGHISEFEISSEIYIGMNGGPLLDKDGNIYGILSSNKNIYVNNILVKRAGIAIKSKDIIEFLNKNNIEYGE